MSDTSITLEGCWPEEILDQEDVVIDIISTSNFYELVGGKLILGEKNGDFLTYIEQSKYANPPFRNTVWELSTINGETINYQESIRIYLDSGVFGFTECSKFSGGMNWNSYERMNFMDLKIYETVCVQNDDFLQNLFEFMELMEEMEFYLIKENQLILSNTKGETLTFHP